MKHIAQQNSTFRSSEPTWANACVGDNGYPQIFDYASGFADAANLLLDQVIKDHGLSHHVDNFIYPICFNMRHAAELFLKAATVSLQKLYKIRGQAIEPFDLEGSHDLGKIWSYVKSNALAFDERYNKLIEALSRGLNDIAEIDSTGQVFRYPFDRENNKHLVAVSVINIIVIRDQWRPLERQLRNLDRLNDDLLLEYAQGAFTAHLSRYQLGKIAAALPRRESWGTAAFNAAKASIRSTYALSGNEFSKALNIIQECRDLAALFGYVTDIPGLKEESIGRFFDIWSKMHDLGRMLKPVDENFDPGISFFDMDPEELRRQRELDAALKRELIRRWILRLLPRLTLSFTSTATISFQSSSSGN